MYTEFSLLFNYLTVCSVDFCFRIVSKSLTWTTNRRMLAGCKRHKMFSFLSPSIRVHSITGQTSKAGIRTPPKEYKFGGHRKR